MNTADHAPDCLSSRIAVAGRHVDRGEWASGHAIAARLLKCSHLTTGCPLADDCACAAELLICDIRRLLAN